MTDQQTFTPEARKAAADLLGMHADEVVDVVTTDQEGVILIRTGDGQTYVATLSAEGPATLAFLVKPTATYNAEFPVAYPDLSLEEALAVVGVDEIGEPDPRPASADLRDPDVTVEEAKSAHPGEIEASAAALVEDPGGSEVPAPGAVSAAESVPEGTVSEVLAWVGDDPERAELALGVEQAREKPRSSLVDHLSDIVDRG